MQAHEQVLVVQQAIQLSVAPVFLLTGIAGLLSVMTSRLSRIIDRAREVGRDDGRVGAADIALALLELAGLERRRQLASWSINCCAGAALMVCTVIVTLFLEEFLRLDLKWLAGAQFIAAMVTVIAGLSCFLGEVYIATQTSRIDAQAVQNQWLAKGLQAATAPPGATSSGVSRSITSSATLAPSSDEKT